MVGISRQLILMLLGLDSDSDVDMDADADASDCGSESAGTKTASADFVSGLVSTLPPLHELTRNVGVRHPEFLDTDQKATELEDQERGDSPRPRTRSSTDRSSGN